MTFETESFEDLSACTTEKLIKLRDRAKQNAIESAQQADADLERLAEINRELAFR